MEFGVSSTLMASRKVTCADWIHLQLLIKTARLSHFRSGETVAQVSGLQTDSRLVFV